MTNWPDINGLAWLHLPCCDAEHPTRVEDLERDEVTVAAPMRPHDALVKPFQSDQEFFLGWVTPRGALETPVMLVEDISSPVPMWTLRAVGEPMETQRRNYVRLPLKMDVHVHLLEGGMPTTATTADLSEGGLRCEVDKWSIDPGDRTFNVDIPMENRILRATGQVVWWGNLDLNDQRTIGIKFIDLDDGESDAIRKYVFAKQTAQRRATW